MASDYTLDSDYEFAQASNVKTARPQSTLARAFAEQLNNVFLLDDQLDKLDQTINRKKQSVSYQNSELAILEARIKQAELLLEEKQRRLSVQDSPTKSTNPAGNGNDASLRCPAPGYAQSSSFSATLDADTKVAAAVMPKSGAKDKTGENEILRRSVVPEPQVKEEYVVVEKTPSVLESRGGGVPTNGNGDYPKHYQVRPPPPPPAVPTAI